MKLIMLASAGSLAMVSAAWAASPLPAAPTTSGLFGAMTPAQYHDDGYGGGYRYREPNDSGYRRRQRYYERDGYEPPRYRDYAPRRYYRDDED